MQYDQEDLNMMLTMLLDHTLFSIIALCGTELQQSALDLLPASGKRLKRKDIIELAKNLTKLHERILVLFKTGRPIGSRLPSFYEHLIQEQNLVVAVLENDQNIYQKIAQYLLYHNAQIYLMNEKHIDPFQDSDRENYANLLKGKAYELIRLADDGADLAEVFFESENFKIDSIQLTQDIQNGKLAANIKNEETEHELMENKLFISLILKNEPQ